MPYHLQNNTFQISVHPGKSTWDIVSAITNGPQLRNAHLSLHYRSKFDNVWALEHWLPIQVGEPEIVSTSQGRSRQLIVHIGPDAHHLDYQIYFSLPEQEPLLMWKLRIFNRSSKPVKIDQIELLNLGFINISHGPTGSSLVQSAMKGGSSSKGSIHFPGRSLSRLSDRNHLAFFSNGWQSWSYTGAYRLKDRSHHTRLGLFRRPMIENGSTSRPKSRGLFRSDMFGVLCDLHSRIGILAGFLSQRNQFGSLETYLDPLNPALRMWASGDGALLDPGQEMETDWACLCLVQLDTPDPLGVFLDAVARENDPLPIQNMSSPAGWCSWYYFSSSDYLGTVTPQAVHQNIDAAKDLNPDLPLDLIQIDDGFQQNVGDWFAFKPDFPEGVTPLAAEIRQAGMTPGLWLAPFIVHPKSDLYHQHSDWLLRNRFGRPVNAGFVWNAFNTALDLTHPQALDYCQEVIHTAVQKWGYNYLKLDFLYAAALPGKFHDPHKTRAQVLRAGLEALRRSAGLGTTLLACGCPLGSAIGLVDSMRIGTDTARTWYPSFNRINTYFNKDYTMPSVRYSLHNALNRSPMHKRWWVNDPDCLLVRSETSLTFDEIQTAASVIALTGGPLLMSDDLPQLPPQRLRLAQVLLPLIDKRPYLLDWLDEPTPSLLQLDLTGPIGSWSLIGIFNWQDKPKESVLYLKDTYLDPDKPYLAREFWSGRFFQIKDGKLNLGEIPAHACVVLAVRLLQSYRPIYVGSNLHISQGQEVSDWHASQSQLTFHLTRPGNIEGMVDIFLPSPPQQVTCDSILATPKLLAENVYRLQVTGNQSTVVTIQM